jgi:hypothetical protein
MRFANTPLRLDDTSAMRSGRFLALGFVSYHLLALIVSSTVSSNDRGSLISGLSFWAVSAGSSFVGSLRLLQLGA